MTRRLLGWVIFSNECALIFFSTTLFSNINITEIDVKMRHEKTPQYFSAELVAICLIYGKRW